MDAYACVLIGRMILSLWLNLPAEEQAYFLARLAMEQDSRFECHRSAVIPVPVDEQVYFFLLCPQRET